VTKLILALDTNSILHANELVKETEPYVDMYKVGLQCFISMGVPYGITRPVFLDLKFHDIPSTVAKAVDSITLFRPEMITVHAAGGENMMKAAKEAAGSMKVLAVTSLTSNDASIGYVYNMCSLASLAGVDGVICSAFEAQTLKLIILLLVGPLHNLKIRQRQQNSLRK